MTTFLAQVPQPGDGSWLLQQRTQPVTRGQHGSRRRARGRKPRTETVLARKDSADADDGERLSQPEKNVTTFLRVYDDKKPTSSPTPAQATQNPTIANGTQLSSRPALEAGNSVVSSGPSTLARTTFITQLPPTPDEIKQASTTSKEIEAEVHSDSSSMSNSKAIPPHRRPRPTPAPVSAETSKQDAPCQPSADDIRSKLFSLGVSVSDAKPAATQNNGWSNPSAHPVIPDSPASDNPVYRGRGGARGNARGQGGFNSAPKQQSTRGSGWLHSKEIPKGDPTRWEADWAGEWQEPNQGWAGESEKCNDSVDSACADGGRGGGGKRRAQDETGYQLADWQGKWAPAPCDWDCRPAFRANQSEDQIWQWIAATEGTLSGENRRPHLDELSTVDGVTYVFGSPQHDKKQDPEGVVYKQMGDIVPRHWIPILYGREAPQHFWHDIVLSTAPPPEDEDDLKGVRPWWEQLVPGGTFMAHYIQPEIKGIDPDESTEERLKREADKGANHHAENRKRFELAKRQDKLAKQKRKDEKSRKVMAAKMVNNGGSPEQLRRISTNVKVFIRHARPEDVHNLRDLYNFYVDFTCAAPETSRVSSGDMLKRINDVRNRKLPFLVACEPGEVIKSRKKRHMGEDLYLPDKLIGFAFADDHTGPRGNMYRYTVEAEVYIHKDFIMKGAAKCLMDKLMAMLDPKYLERGGYDVHGDDLETGVARPSRVIKTVLMYFSHESTKPAKLEWVNQWLRSFMGFESVGYLESIGSKLGFSVNQAIFQRGTGVTIDDANPPDVLRTPPKTF